MTARNTDSGHRFAHPPDPRTREERLEDALRQVLTWPLPDGTVETHYLPGWLYEIAHDALGDGEKQT